MSSVDTARAPERPPEGKEKGEMRLIARASAILRALADQPGGASLGDLAAATGLARATVQRIVDALEVERLVSAGAGAGALRLGLEISRLASFVQSDARRLLRPFAEDLLRRVQETVDITILDGSSVIVIDQLPSQQSLRVVSHVGRPLPFHATASGKAHLAQMDPARRQTLLDRPLERHSANTKTLSSALLDEIRGSLQIGYFVDDQEYADGICALAIPAPLAGGNFALALSMPTHRFAANLERYAQAILDVRSALSAAIDRGAGDFRRDVS
jgi:IclR family acetate operon transcriptional repressor